ncbi:hypothetical protein AB0M54_45885 [Actinoplanes sp. NPDC051470]|uniref:hypothetical protein n=1 Tax=Actinoplanes sp. NPDC051470 TaxID=3157224 RepID=UPI003418D85C
MKMTAEFTVKVTVDHGKVSIVAVNSEGDRIVGTHPVDGLIPAWDLFSARLFTHIRKAARQIF